MMFSKKVVQLSLALIVFGSGCNQIHLIEKESKKSSNGAASSPSAPTTPSSPSELSPVGTSGGNRTETPVLPTGDSMDGSDSEILGFQDLDSGTPAMGDGSTGASQQCVPPQVADQWVGPYDADAPFERNDAEIGYVCEVQIEALSPKALSRSGGTAIERFLVCVDPRNSQGKWRKFQGTKTLGLYLDVAAFYRSKSCAQINVGVYQSVLSSRASEIEGDSIYPVEAASRAVFEVKSVFDPAVLVYGGKQSTKLVSRPSIGGDYHLVAECTPGPSCEDQDFIEFDQDRMSIGQ